MDRKLVTLDFDLRGRRRRQEQARTNEAETRLAAHLLVRDSKYRTLYRQLLAHNLADLLQQRKNMDQRWTTTLNSALEAAADSVGHMPLVTHTKEVDPEISRLSYEQRQLRQLIYNSHRQDVKGFRLRRNRLLHQIRERSKALARAFVDANSLISNRRGIRSKCSKPRQPLPNGAYHQPRYVAPQVIHYPPRSRY